MNILIADDDPVSSRLLSATLSMWGHEVMTAINGEEAWEVLKATNKPLLAILDWMMPDVEGVELCRRVRTGVNGVPVYLILLTSMNRKENLIAGLDAGADDYLTKPFDPNELRVRLKVGARIIDLQKDLYERVKELEEAIVERQRAEEALRNLSLTDPMTGLYNYRGFFTLAEHEARLARRRKQTSLLIYADMDGLKQINDTLGHAEGSAAITKTAEILRRTFRDCDIVARLGGDEFAVLVPNVSRHEMEPIIDRLRENITAYNEANNHQFQLSLSIGATELDHNGSLTIEEQMSKADHAMYRDKRTKRQQQNLVGVTS